MSGPSSNITFKKSKVEKNEGLWLYSFCDLSLILMSFFALLLSMSTLNASRIQSVADEFQNKKTARTEALPAIEKDIRKEIERLKLQDAVDVSLDAEGVAVEFKDQLLFDPASASIKQQYAQTSRSILQLIGKANPKYKVTIEGHTDDTPLGSHDKFHSNWELSAARGISLLNHLRSVGITPDRMRVVSYADTRPKVTINGKTGDELRKARAANRRVVIRLD